MQDFVLTEDGVRLFAETLGDSGPWAIVPNGFYLRADLAPLAQRRRILFYDPRNRGRSDAVADRSKLEGGIHNDVLDLEAVRRRLGEDRVDLIAHSYMALTAILHAAKHGGHVNRIVLLGAMGPYPEKRHAADLAHTDAVTEKVFADLADLQGQRSSYTPEEFCQAFWLMLRPLYVADPADADKIRWGRCDLANERGFMRYWMEFVLPSLRALALTPEDASAVAAPVLIIHGREDRSAPYGGALDWARLLSNARLLTIDGGGHAPWIEAPDAVLRSIQTFLDGDWPPLGASVTLDASFPVAPSGRGGA